MTTTPTTTAALDEHRARLVCRRAGMAEKHWRQFLDHAEAWRNHDEDAGLMTVPREATPEMLQRMAEMYMPFGEMVSAWDGAVDASPFAKKDLP